MKEDCWLLLVLNRDLGGGDVKLNLKLKSRRNRSEDDTNYSVFGRSVPNVEGVTFEECNPPLL